MAAALALVLGSDGHVEGIRHTAKELATNRKRSVLLLLLIRRVAGNAHELAHELADMLPNDHPGLEWALSGEIDWEDDKRLSDLGDVGICHEVFGYMMSRQTDLQDRGKQNSMEGI